MRIRRRLYLAVLLAEILFFAVGRPEAQTPAGSPKEPAPAAREHNEHGIALARQGEVTSEAFAFHSALLALWKRQRRLFIDFRGKILPYDDRYKGVIEFTFEDDSLNGFRVYWPNGTVGVCARNADGRCLAQNIVFRPYGSIDFFVGILASRPGTFSPCVEADQDPEYALVPGTEKRPHWPSDLRPYAL